LYLLRLESAGPFLLDYVRPYPHLARLRGHQGFSELPFRGPYSSRTDRSRTVHQIDPAAMSESRLAVLRDLARTARERRFHLVVVVPPDVDAAPEAFAERYVARLRPLAIEEQFIVADWRRPAFLSADHFFDHVHLNGDGAKVFGEKLGEFLATVVPADTART